LAASSFSTPHFLSILVHFPQGEARTAHESFFAARTHKTKPQYIKRAQQTCLLKIITGDTREVKCSLRLKLQARNFETANALLALCSRCFGNSLRGLFNRVKSNY